MYVLGQCHVIPQVSVGNMFHHLPHSFAALPIFLALNCTELRRINSSIKPMLGPPQARKLKICIDSVYSCYAA